MLPSTIASPDVPVAHQVFVPYWSAEAGWHTELQLRNNRESGDLTVTSVLRSFNGNEFSLPPVTVAPNEVQTVDLGEQIARNAPQLGGSYGSLLLRYSSPAMRNLYAAVMIHDMGYPIAFHLDASGEPGGGDPELNMSHEVGSREGIWWLPRDSVTDYLILTNFSNAALNAALTLYDPAGKASQQEITLSARETRRLSVRSLLHQAGLNGSYGGIQINATKGSNYLDSVHVTFDEAGGVFRADENVST